MFLNTVLKIGNLEVPISSPTGNGKSTVKYTHLEFRERSGWRQKFLSHQHMDGFQTTRPDEVTPGREEEGHGHACGPHQPTEVGRAMGKPRLRRGCWQGRETTRRVEIRANHKRRGFLEG